MHAQLSKFLQDLRASYWFIPACMVIVAIGLSILMTWLDANYEASWMRDFQWLTAARTDGARSVLNVIAGSTIGVAGVTFSITIVAVSFASANFGPRLIANFMRDRGNQVTLGTFIGTYVYCLLVLRTVRNASAPEIENSFQAFVPHFSVLMALVLALASMCVLIYFIHHVPESLNVGNLAAKVGNRLRDGIDELFPNKDDWQAEEPVGDTAWTRRGEREHQFQIKADQSGYIQALDIGRLVELAEAHQALVKVQYRPGDFVVHDAIVIDVWTDEDLGDDDRDKFSACFATGNERTAHQNALFLADQLVEIIGRAMSPGINDPFTAITCLSWLHVGLLHFMKKDRSGTFPDPSDRVRIYPITFERFASVVFDQVLPYTCHDPNVVMHTITVITELVAVSENAEHTRVLRLHLEKLSAAAAAELDDDVRGHDVQERIKEARRILSAENGYDVHRQSQNWFGGRA